MSVKSGANDQNPDRELSALLENTDLESEYNFSEDLEHTGGGEAMADPMWARAVKLREQCKQWVVSLKQVLDDPDGRNVFNLYLEAEVGKGGDKAAREQAAWLFYLACTELQAETHPIGQRSMARSIYDDFVRPRTDQGGRMTVSLLQQTEADLLRKFHNWAEYRGEAARVFDEAQRECKRLLEWSCYPAFKESTFLVDWMCENGVFPHEVLHPELGLCDTPSSVGSRPGKTVPGNGRTVSGATAIHQLASEHEAGRPKARKERHGLPAPRVALQLGDDGMAPRERMRQEDLYRDEFDAIEMPRSRHMLAPSHTAPPPVPPRVVNKKTEAQQLLDNVKQRCQPYLQPPPPAYAAPGSAAWRATTAQQMQHPAGTVLYTSDSGVGRSSVSGGSRMGQRKETVPASGSVSNERVQGGQQPGSAADITVMWQMEMKGEMFSAKYGRPYGSGIHWQQNIRFTDILHILPAKFRDDRLAQFYCKMQMSPQEVVWQEMTGAELVPLFEGRIVVLALAGQ